MNEPTTVSKSGTLGPISLAGLDPYIPNADKPWDRKRVSHLLRRAGYPGTGAQVAQALTESPEQTIDRIIQAALDMPLPDPIPIFSVDPPADAETNADFKSMNADAASEFRRDILRRTYTDGLRERMTFLWSNHFVVEHQKYRWTGFTDRYYRTLRSFALGNFKDFVHEMGRDPAMLIYLDGDDNRAGAVNENYGREVLELFTLGLDQYSQMDVREASKALTGWVDNNEGYSSEFVESRFDNSEKTIFGKTGNWGYDDLMNLIFDEKPLEASKYISTKIYKLFVQAKVDESVTDAMAQLMRDNNFEIKPVVEALLKSDHFFESQFIGARIKGPVELFSGMTKFLSYDHDSVTLLDNFQIKARAIGQVILNPPNVKGHLESKTWISSGFLINRWTFAGEMVRRGVDLTEILTWTESPLDPYLLAGDIAREMLPSYPLTDEDITNFGDILLGGAPAYEWNPENGNAPDMLKQLLLHIVQLPAYQLM